MLKVAIKVILKTEKSVSKACYSGPLAIKYSISGRCVAISCDVCVCRSTLVLLRLWVWFLQLSQICLYRDDALDRPCPDRPSRDECGAFASLTSERNPWIEGNLQTFTNIENIGAEPGVRKDFGLASAGGANQEADICIRPMGEADLERILELRSVVRWAADPRAFDLLRGMREARWALAEDRNGTLAGMVGAVPFGGIGIVCHLAVRGGYRKMGLGTGLTTWATTYLRSRGAALIRLYSTPEAEKIYRSAGFSPVSARTVYRLESASQRPEIYKGNYRIETLTTRDLPELFGVDYWSYGADRSGLILATFRLHPGRSLVARDASGRVKGYLLQSTAAHATNHSTTHVGPFMASSPELARLLLYRALEDSGDEVLEATVTGDGPAHSLFEEFGSVGREDRLRMELGRVETQPALDQYGTTPYLAT